MNFRPEWSQWNGGFIGACVLVNEPGRIMLVPFKSLKMSEYQRCVFEVVRQSDFPACDTIYSDRETAVYSQKFRDHVKKEYNVNIGFLTRNSKAWRSERTIATVKRRLQTILDAQDSSVDKRAKFKWVAHIPAVVALHNAQPAHETSYARDQVS